MDNTVYKDVLITFFEKLTPLGEDYVKLYEKFNKMEITDSFLKKLNEIFKDTETVKELSFLKKLNFSDKWAELSEDKQSEIDVHFMTLKGSLYFKDLMENNSMLNNLMNSFKKMSSQKSGETSESGDSTDENAKVFDDVLKKLKFNKEDYSKFLNDFLESIKETYAYTVFIELQEKLTNDEEYLKKFKDLLISVYDFFEDDIKELETLITNEMTDFNMETLQKLLKVLNKEKIKDLVSRAEAQFGEDFKKLLNVDFDKITKEKNLIFEKVKVAVFNMFPALGNSNNPMLKSMIKKVSEMLGFKSTPKTVDPEKKQRRRLSKYRREFKKKMKEEEAAEKKKRRKKRK